MIYGITLIILGILASPSILLAKRPDAKKILDKIVPYQGWAGLVFCVWGVWGIISALLSLGLLADAPIWWITQTGASVIEAILGFILGYAMISQLVLSKNAAAKKKGEQILAKLTPIQAKLGMVGIGFGVWVIVASILFSA